MKFIRRNSTQISKLGMKRKNKQVWRKPKGRDNKMREMKRGYPAIVKIGYRSPNSERGKLNGIKIKLVYNVGQILQLNNNQTVIFGKVGKKNKIAMAKLARERKIHVANLNVNKFLNRLVKEKKNGS